MANAAPIHFTEAVESRQDDEQATIQELNETFDKILDTTAKDYGHAVRSVHAKAHGILQGTLTVASGLPPELAQGMFAKPGEHTVFMRLSTNAGDILPDAISLPRGLALKVLDVDGERLPGAEGRTQNFVMINGPVFQAKTADKFLGSLKKLAGTTDKMEGVKTAMSSVMRGVSSALETVGIESPTIQSMGGAPNVDPLGETYYSVTPFRYGDYIAKFAVVPVSDDLTVADQEGDRRDGPAGRHSAERRGRDAGDGRRLGGAGATLPRPGEAAGRGSHRRVEGGGQPVSDRGHHPCRPAGQLGCQAGAEGGRGDAFLPLDRARGAPALG